MNWIGKGIAIAGMWVATGWMAASLVGTGGEAMLLLIAGFAVFGTLAVALTGDN